jgi:hypothetical protein
MLMDCVLHVIRNNNTTQCLKNVSAKKFISKNSMVPVFNALQKAFSLTKRVIVYSTIFGKMENVSDAIKVKMDQIV